MAMDGLAMILFNVTYLVLGGIKDCPRSNEVTLKHMDICIYLICVLHGY